MDKIEAVLVWHDGQREEFYRVGLNCTAIVQFYEENGDPYVEVQRDDEDIYAVFAQNKVQGIYSFGFLPPLEKKTGE